MKPQNLNKIINLIREQMVANAPGTSGGFGGSSDPKGPTSGFDSPIKFSKRRPQIKLPSGSRKRWMEFLKGKSNVQPKN
jgi:hypothetical protein